MGDAGCLSEPSETWDDCHRMGDEVPSFVCKNGHPETVLLILQVGLLKEWGAAQITSIYSA